MLFFAHFEILSWPVVTDILNSKPSLGFISSLLFEDSKRPITVELLQRLNLHAIAKVAGLAERWASRAVNRFLFQQARGTTKPDPHGTLGAWQDVIVCGKSPEQAQPSVARYAAVESILQGRHPWLFAGSVREQNRDGEPGELAVIFRPRRTASGRLDCSTPDSPIRVRVLRRGKPCAIDRDWWRNRAADTLKRREGLFDAQTTGYRLINGESDGWPGLVLDRYGETLVLIKFTPPRGYRAWRKSPTLLATDARLILRLSRNIHKMAAAERFRPLGWARVLRERTARRAGVFYGERPAV